MYCTYRTQLSLLFSIIGFVYVIMLIEYNIWKMQDKDGMFKGTTAYKRKAVSAAKLKSGLSKNVLNENNLNNMKDKVFKLLMWQQSDENQKEIYKDSLSNCKYTNCNLALDNAEITSSDAILIPMSFLLQNRTLPNYRTPNQTWILHSMSPLLKLNPVSNLKQYNGIFNAVATYRHTSDIYTPYGEAVHKDNVVKVVGSKVNFAKGKTRKVAVILDKCNTQSHREGYIRELEKHISVEVYGTCGTKHSCTQHHNHPSKDQCYKTMAITHKFYLAFEDNLCEEYITEELWKVLQLNIIPVVLGNANYTRVLPPHSYIDVRDFKSPKSLGDFLAVLDRHEDLYNAFFLWKQYYDIKLWSDRPGFVCRVCEYLNTVSGKKKTYNKLQKLWHSNQLQCVSPRNFYKNIFPGYYEQPRS